MIRSSVMRKACSLAAIYFGSLGACIFLFTSQDREANAAALNCQACSAGVLTQKDVFGGWECEHGPENDPNACFQDGKVDFMTFNPGQACWEVNGGKNNPVTNMKCECFKCYKDKGCEPIVELYEAWCGSESATNKGQCQTKEGAVEAVARRERKQKHPEGKTCGDLTDGIVSIKFCGLNTTSHYGCKTATANCAADGEWVEVGKKVKLPVCGN